MTPTPEKTSRRRILLALAVAAVVAGCWGDDEEGRRAGSAVWVDGASEPLTIASYSRLESAGVTELYVEAATVEWQGDRAQVTPSPLAGAPGKPRAMLVVRGAWPLAIGDAQEAARSLVGGLEAQRRAAEEAGWAVAGWHLDFAGLPPERLPKALRSTLDPRLLLAATVPGSSLSDDSLEDLLDAADFVAAFLYGVREGERDRPEAWDFRRVRAQVSELEEREEPYLVGVVMRGSATLIQDGQAVSELPGVSLATLAWNRGLRLRHGFSLEGIDRQVYEFGAYGPARVGEARLTTGDSVRVVTTSTAHLQELRRQLDEWKPRFRLGELYYKLPGEGDVLSLRADNVAHAASSERLLPRPKITIFTLGESANRVVVRLRLENDSPEASDLGQVDSNFVEVRAVGGNFGSVAPGRFLRYDTLAPDGRGELRRTIRNPTVLRLYAPVLGPRATLDSGPLELRGSGGGKVEDLLVTASFLAPYGGSAEMPVRSWLELAPPPTPTPTPTPRRR
jgi:hypothetical protein